MTIVLEWHSIYAFALISGLGEAVSFMFCRLIVALPILGSKSLLLAVSNMAWPASYYCNSMTNGFVDAGNRHKE
ncbi:hypothetical protein VNO77_02886 [Canavalia gladiata]|uniref:Uncharacterized protein n=1 Tax=Canavalia gladiata TaxID=3824 RepID=A0AAN9MTX4_CANGL